MSEFEAICSTSFSSLPKMLSAISCSQIMIFGKGKLASAGVIFSFNLAVFIGILVSIFSPLSPLTFSPLG